MKKLILSAAAVAAMVAPGVASADTKAVVGLDYSNTNIDDFDIDLENYGLNGGFSHEFGNGWTLQMDGRHGRVDTDIGFGDLSSSYGALHLGQRTDNYAYAGFIGLDEFFSVSGASVG